MRINLIFDFICFQTDFLFHAEFYLINLINVSLIHLLKIHMHNIFGF